MKKDLRSSCNDLNKSCDNCLYLLEDGSCLIDNLRLLNVNYNVKGDGSLVQILFGFNRTTTIDLRRNKVVQFNDVQPWAETYIGIINQINKKLKGRN